MNKNLRDLLNNLSKSIGLFCKNFVSSFVSLLRMMVLSRFAIAKQSKHYKELKTSGSCTVLANGPSLKSAFENGEVRLEGNDIIVVNMFAQSSEFWTIKPRFYCLVDGNFFAPTNERVKEQINILSEAFDKVDWDMYLCISSGCVNGGILKNLHNNHIHILKWNTTTFEGFKSLCHYMFRHNMAMPRCQTVTNMALVAAVNLGYENVYLYGADHTWTIDLRVNERNEVCYGDRHIYATGLHVIKKDCSIGTLLHQFARMFDSHWVINDYAESRGVRIYNCTKGSFVDAYERL